MEEINEECKGCLCVRYGVGCLISQRPFVCADDGESHCVCQRCLIKSICQEPCQEFRLQSVTHSKKMKDVK